MNYLLAFFSMLVGLYSLPLMISYIRDGYSEDSKLFYYISCFLFITFPLVNFANSIDMLFFETYKVSYACGIYGLVFILSSFFVPDEVDEVIKE